MKQNSSQSSRSTAYPAAKVMLLAVALLGTPTAIMAATEGATITTTQAAQQGRTITGRVLDELGEPMIGVTIKVAGSNVATITDLDGNYTLGPVSGKARLNFSYVGYKEKSVVATGSTQDVNMVPDDTSLDDVVVVGYGTMRKRDLTGAISQVKEEDIKMTPSINAMEGLQGKIAGLDITRTSGLAGSTPEILLRGNRSLNADCSPLYVIDGVSGGDITSLNPNDIESIEVLKDASSTAIYGSAGANGVIIVTTKQGTTGKVAVNFDAYIGINAFPSYPSTLTGDDWIDFLTEGYVARYNAEPADLSELFNAAGMSEGAIEAYNEGKWVDWKDELLHTGVEQNYNISIRGGNEKQQSYMSAGFMSEKGVYQNDKQEQLTFRTGTTFNINKMFTVGYQSTLYYRNRDTRSSRLNKTLNQIPLGDVYDEDGNLNNYPISDMSSYVNILLDDDSGRYKNNTKSMNLKVAPFVEFKPFKGFSFKSLFNGSISNSRRGIWSGLDTYMKVTGSEANTRTATYYTSNSWSWMWQNIVNYNFKIKELHDITLTGITEYSKSRSETGNIYNENFKYEDFLWYNMSAGDNPTVSTSYSEQSKMSYALRANYSYLGRYLASVSVRWDGASQLYDKWCAFPAFSLGWRISDEPFMAATRNWLDNLKIRLGYGVTGNSNIDPYVTLTQVTNSSSYLTLGNSTTQGYILAQNVANYDLTWEKSYNWNLGLDFSVLNGRIDGSIELYTTDTKGVLYNRPIPTALGLYNAKATYYKMSNIARIKNKGIEITINSRNIDKKNFKWNSTFTFATNDEKLKEINLGNDVTVDELISLGLFLDNPVKTYYGYKKAGIWQLGQENKAICFGSEPGDVAVDVPGLIWDSSYTYTVTTTDDDGTETTTTYNGAYYKASEDTYDDDGNVVHTYYTADNPYSVGADDKQILGHKTPDWTIGLQNTFQFHNWDLSIMATMRWGQMVESDILGYWSNTNIPDSYDYWTESNPTNAFPRPHFGSSLTTAQEEALQYVDGSYFKIKNITLGYTFPQKALKRAGISRLRVYGTVTNPFIISKSDMLKGIDPENGGSDSYPLYRTMVFGVNLSF